MRTAPSAQTGSKLRGGNSPGQLNKIQWLSGRRFKCSTDHRVGGIFFPWHLQFNHESWEVTRISPFIVDTPCHYSWKNTNLWCDRTRDNQTRKWHTPEYSQREIMGVTSCKLSHKTRCSCLDGSNHLNKRSHIHILFILMSFIKISSTITKKTTCHHMNN